MNLTIETLIGNNFKKWKNDLEIYLGVWDLDLALREPRPVIVITSTRAEKDKAEKWDRDNRLSLKIMQKAMTETTRGGIPLCKTATEYLEAIEEKYKESDKAETTNHLNSLMTLKFDGVSSVREHCLKMIDVANKLKALESPIADPMLVHMILMSLPPQYSQLITTYNTQREKWSINELISICAQEESRIKKEKGKGVATVNLVNKEETKTVHQKKSSNSSKKFHKGSTSARGSHSLKVNKNPTVFKCYFCDKVGHLKRNCHKYKGWLSKKGIHKKEGTK
ncbi:putative transcription factor interactor and regulator CCHC(Zn) family [Rosa chinensis]|uniref:Putative transcription factor interactor and regulator CCHC(Zn) family n=1 Tax=Rosa chinensis TaxID=74649 RepID=A0A2P6Q241_ROSCH|nr:putative transcription factor interactor and regulator CCHC(Zn) family [Rosa chinensis]